jgi:predicted transcriptional regulator
LKDAPIRTGANAVLDQELKDTLSAVADQTRGDLSWAAEARLSLKGIQTVEMDSFITHIVRVGESLEKQGEVTATEMEDFGHFFKLGHTILTDKRVPCVRPALIEGFRNAEEQDGYV